MAQLKYFAGEVPPNGGTTIEGTNLTANTTSLLHDIARGEAVQVAGEALVQQWKIVWRYPD